MPTYVIEHMEPDTSTHEFPPWVSLEYTQMLRLAVPSTVIFSSLSPASVSSLSPLLVSRGADKQRFRAETKPVLELMKEQGVDLSKVCLLDPKAEKVLSPEDAGEFEWFLFGGILGDDPPRDRTGELRRLNFPTRHLGPIQMTTDTALGVTRRVVQDGVPLDQIPFIDHPTIRFSAQESVEMPFRYITDAEGEPILPEGMRELLRDDMDKGFDALDEEEEQDI